MEEIHEIEMHEGEGGNTVIDVETSEHNSFGNMAEIEIAEGVAAIDVETMEIESSDSSDEVTKIEQVVGQHGLHNLIQSLKDLDDIKSFTIFRVPAYFRENSKAMYEPKMVSIGPYHHGKEELRTMEEHKRRCLRDFLNRNKKRSIENYYQEMRMLEMGARQHYSEGIKMDSNQFAIMLLLDGCFILEYFLKYRDSVVDSLCDAYWSNPMNTDFILLENQIPLFVIHKLAFLLLDLIDKPNCGRKCPLLDLIFPCLPQKKKLGMRKPEISCDGVDHLLHFYHKCLVPEHDHEQSSSQCTQPVSIKTRSLSWLWSWIPSFSRVDSSINVFPCATVLNDSGVTFRRKQNSRDIFDITFHKGIMEMPLLTVDDGIKIIFTNVTAFEQSQTEETTFTSFVVLMDLIIDTKNDVGLLKECGVMESLLQNDEESADFFNTLADQCSFNPSRGYYANLIRKVNNYSNSTWPKYRAKLMHDYFSNPWTSISVFAGTLLLGLTVTQTYYTIYSAYHH